ncbi:Nop domain-containing protein [Basidiobolus meristosporus CBS 931.73]|uniref:Nop domain-containing protein n=1 Tax=Basidiobolus meristosporus CBS 931.73 TaxID=1314790 RepID=A0A1Y1YZQ7_9FUNG|nr:Nop domain-containing protein [Basidiobolus meristosporus CBS 931.73]|eukprot:ORY03530.1 Nop domain-containing protein [Basidiobolus meristosporus CBS 931.73]
MDEAEDEDAMEDDESNVDEDKLATLLKNSETVDDVAKLHSSKELNEVLTKIEHFKGVPREATQLVGVMEEDPEYKLIVKANDLTAAIDTEIISIHKFIRDHYAPKFPELESLVPSALDYARAVKTIGNESDITKVDLRSILPSATIMVVTVTGSTTAGRPLDEREYKIVMDACDMALQLDEAKKTILEYVESRMSFIAPNLSAIIGSATAAKLMGAAGGLTSLSKMPACNIQVLGATKKTQTGFSSVTINRHAGFIYHSEYVQRIPSDLRQKATRILAAKCTLAARVDRGHESIDGSIGRKFREEIDQKIEKLVEPPPGKNIKALPAPDDAPKKRRGGRRVRKQKEAYAVTDLRKAQNRMSFGVAEDEVGSMDSTRGLGMIGANSGKVRAAVADSRAKVPYKKPKILSGSSGATSGLSSSLAFTPAQGLELENPEAREQRIRDINSKYFDDAAGFLKVGQSKN